MAVKSVSIVGAGRSLANYFESAPVVWGVGLAGIALRKQGKRCDAMFWADDLATTTKDYDPELYDILTDHYQFRDMPLWTSQRNGLKHAHLREFPIHDCVEKFKTDYLNNSTAFAICKAELDGFDEVHLHGVDFLYDPEVPDRSHHLGCVMWWLGFLEARGMVIKINPASVLKDTMHRHMRGYTLRGYLIDFIKTLPTTDPVTIKEWMDGTATRYVFEPGTRSAQFNLPFGATDSSEQTPANPAANARRKSRNPARTP